MRIRKELYLIEPKSKSSEERKKSLKKSKEIAKKIKKS